MKWSLWFSPVWWMVYVFRVSDDMFFTSQESFALMNILDHSNRLFRLSRWPKNRCLTHDCASLITIAVWLRNRPERTGVIWIRRGSRTFTRHPIDCGAVISPPALISNCTYYQRVVHVELKTSASLVKQNHERFTYSRKLVRIWMRIFDTIAQMSSVATYTRWRCLRFWWAYTACKSHSQQLLYCVWETSCEWE